MLLRHCRTAVVTLGSQGCAAACRDSDGNMTALREPAVAGVQVVDSTGAGDAFSSGCVHEAGRHGGEGRGNPSSGRKARRGDSHHGAVPFTFWAMVG